MVKTTATELQEVMKVRPAPTVQLQLPPLPLAAADCGDTPCVWCLPPCLAGQCMSGRQASLGALGLCSSTRYTQRMLIQRTRTIPAPTLALGMQEALNLSMKFSGLETATLQRAMLWCNSSAVPLVYGLQQVDAELEAAARLSFAALQALPKASGEVGGMKLWGCCVAR